MSTRLSPSRWGHGSLALAIAGGYLLLVVSILAVVLMDVAFVDHPDASMIGVLLYLVTLPLSLVGIMVVPDSAGPLASAAFFAVPAVCALMQAGGLWLALRGERRPVR